MARIIGGIGTSHVPTIAMAFDRKKQDDPDWKPLFAGYEKIAAWLAEKKPEWSVTVVEAGRRLFDLENRMSYRRRSMIYGENQWPGDFIEDQAPEGMITRTMAVGGSAMHWQGHANRFSAEDLRLQSMYGLAVDWPLSWQELEPYLGEAERQGLMLDQRLAERAALLGVLDRQLHRLLGRTDAPRAERRTTFREAALGVLHALPFLADQRLGGNAGVLEDDLGDL